MNAQSLTEVLRRAAPLLSLPPPPFLTGMLSGLLLGILLTSLAVGRSGLATALLRVGRVCIALAPPVLACLLWGAWVGIVAAKEMLH
ncbi:MAG TPA: hypothetical protein VK821_20435 [Dehalococcoidia bacterium]|nr:hypothetical protein [Dehalococcoidia bacterium]